MCFATLSSLKGYLLYLESILLMKDSDVSLGSSTPLLGIKIQNLKVDFNTSDALGHWKWWLRILWFHLHGITKHVLICNLHKNEKL